jgi:hypothetical protein
VDALAGIERDLGHLGAVAEEAGASDPARATLRRWCAPVGNLGRQLQCAQRSWVAGEQVASQVDGVAADSDRELVDRRFARELRVRVTDRSPASSRGRRSGERSPMPCLASTGHRLGVQRPRAPHAAIGHGARKCRVRDRLSVPPRRNLDRWPPSASEHC